MIPFNPIERAKNVEKVVMRGNERKYYRFCYTRYYGGIVTADTVGCNLLCAYCWNYFKNFHPERYGEFYSLEEVANRLLNIAKAKRCYLFRISGAEPILGEKSAKHTAEVIEKVKGMFILETNGLMFGYSPKLLDYFEGLNVTVRVTVKLLADSGYDCRDTEEIAIFRPIGRSNCYNSADRINLFLRYLFCHIIGLYGKRWKVETVFSVIKRRFGDRIKSKLNLLSSLPLITYDPYPYFQQCNQPSFYSG